MLIEPNVLKRLDLASLTMVENSFLEGPLAEALQQAPAIERQRGLSAEDFYSDYRALLRPVILEGAAAGWPAVQTWNFEQLAERCGFAQVTVNAYSSQHARDVTFADFVRMLRAGAADGAMPLYLQEWYFQADCPELALDLPELAIAQYDFRRDLYGEAVSTNHQLWIGQQGGITRLHQDSYMVDAMHVQLVGSKRWIVMGPEALVNGATEPASAWQALVDSPLTQLMQCTLKPGDVLYLPALWFHRVELLSDSIGLGRKCLDPKHLRMHIHQRMAELLTLALNPEEIQRAHPGLFNAVLMRNRSWARRMQIDLTKLRP